MRMPTWHTHTQARTTLLILLLVVVSSGMFADRGKESAEPFEIRIVDAQTGAGVSGLRVTADNGIVCYTRASGGVRFGEGSLMNRNVYFRIEGQDHHLPGGGKTIRVTHGGHVELKVSR